MSELGINTLALHPVGGETTEKTACELAELCEYNTEFRSLIDLADKKSLSVEYELHALNHLLPRAEFKNHPEWFRMNKEGERTPDANMCLSNPQALEYVGESAVKFANSLYRNGDRHYFWMADDKHKKCNCPECAQLSPSDQQLKLMNSMVTALRRVNPQAQLAYIAYLDTLPVPEKIKPADGIFLEYAPFERDFTKPVRDSLPESEIANLKALLEYFGKENSQVLEYWYDNSLFSKWKKPPKLFTPNNEMIKNDIAFYKELGFERVASFACYLGPDYEELFGAPDISAFGC